MTDELRQHCLLPDLHRSNARRSPDTVQSENSRQPEQLNKLLSLPLRTTENAPLRSHASSRRTCPFLLLQKRLLYSSITDSIPGHFACTVTKGLK